MPTEDLEFANDPAGAIEAGGASTGWRVLLTIAALIAVGIFWADRAEVEQVTTGQGKVIPSSQVQTVESLEPGIVADILIKAGDRVTLGQELIRIDDTGAASKLGELSERQAALTAERNRLRAELAGETSYEMTDVSDAKFRQFYLDHLAVFEANRLQLDEQASIRRQQLVQKEQSLAEAIASAQKTEELLELARKEEQLIRRLFERKAIPEIDFLRVQKESTQLAGDLVIWKATKARLAAEVEEARALIGTEEVKFRAQATGRLSKVNADLAVVEQTLKAASDTVRRAVLRSPVNGIVNKVNVTAINEVVRAGDSVVEIVPVDDTLLVETQIRPEDIAFIRAGLKATIRISAFDYTRYGTMEGVVQRIGADTITNENRETFYQVVVSTEKDEAGSGGARRLDIIPGMIATVDIATGNRTVLEYLLKPILVMRDRALRDPR
ncbi:MAG: HlyD family type I secretion periplasmic adaptor subunit [Rhizobiaceae bacterium]|nr:HlyD family type I secretion periplasmic adaptor subunit [Hyphomicrobiales bacterium]NRB32387.1 HlyD family type I secretion periplasmic adaptor subunit [Rhizobiaceae bacterium]